MQERVTAVVLTQVPQEKPAAAAQLDGEEVRREEGGDQVGDEEDGDEAGVHDDAVGIVDAQVRVVAAADDDAVLGAAGGDFNSLAGFVNGLVMGPVIAAMFAPWMSRMFVTTEPPSPGSRIVRGSASVTAS